MHKSLFKNQILRKSNMAPPIARPICSSVEDDRKDHEGLRYYLEDEKGDGSDVRRDCERNEQRS